MRKVYSLLLVLFSVVVFGQTNTENYIQSTTYKVPVDIGSFSSTVVHEDDKIETISYSDGMGRPKQSIALRAGGSKENIVQHYEYDDLGRTPKQYLPYATSTQLPIGTSADYLGMSTALSATESFYNTTKYENTINPYSHTTFEPSPRSRPLEQGAPGASWVVDTGSSNDHTIKSEYDFNGNNEVKQFLVTYASGGAAPTLVYNGYFEANELTKSIMKDENWKPSKGATDLTQSFTNKNGQMILKRQRVFDAQRTTNQTYNIDTYYVYDDYGNLAFVLSPEGSDAVVNLDTSINQTILDQFCYQYRYDHRNRLIEKKIPGKGVESIVYDALDRPILTQDPELKLDSDKWLFTKYDIFDRVVYTGIYDAPSFEGTRDLLQGAVDNLPSSSLHETRTATTTSVGINNTPVYYTNNAFPKINEYMEVLTQSYYDDYAVGVSAPSGVTSFNQAITTRTKGMPTVSKVKVLFDDTVEYWITTVTGYDEKGRVIVVDSKNPFLEKNDYMESFLDFTGKPLQTLSTHSDVSDVIPVVITMKDYFTYDHMDRLINHTQEIEDEGRQLIAENTYDELGQLEKKKVGGELWKSGYTAVNGVSVVNNVITKTASDGFGNASVSTVGAIGSYGGVSFTAASYGKSVMVGLNDAHIDDSYTEIDYAIYLYTNGSNVTQLQLKINSGWLAVGNYQIGDTFAVERSMNDILFIKNGTVIHTHTITGSFPASFVADSSFNHTGAAISNLQLYATTITQHLQNVDYKYNVRGWLTEINDINPVDQQVVDLFAFKINYDKPDYNSQSLVDPLYNGNISQTIWRTAKDNEKRSYHYTYDDTDRLISATGRNGSSLNTFSIYNLYDVNYDKNGNLEKLSRDGQDDLTTNTGEWDDLVYHYTGNQLINVDDNTVSTLKAHGFDDGNTEYTTSIDDFEYDSNGNMIRDANKGITSITYNHLNLPELISISNGSQVGTIEYIYDAVGIKLRKIATVTGVSTNQTDYAGGFVYLDDSLEFISQPEGYIMPVGESEESIEFIEGGQSGQTSYQYVFQYLDHLGNVRLSYSDEDRDGVIQVNTEIIEESNYYPFGLKHQGYNNTVLGGNDLAQNWKFGGKEYNQELGLDWYDITARNYDPAIGRWMNLDPLAEGMRRHSPYNYAFDNPIFFIDPDGMFPAVSAANGNKGFAEIGSGSYISITTTDSKGNVLDSENIFNADDTYKVGKNGEITKVDGKTYHDKNGNEVDRLYSTDKKGNMTEDFVEVGSDALSTKKKGTGKITENGNSRPFDYQHLSFGNKIVEATRVFEFLALNTDVEFSLVNSRDFDNISKSRAEIYTSFEGLEEYQGPRRAITLARFGLLYSFSHSHPSYNSYKSSVADDKNRGDIFRVNSNPFHKPIINIFYNGEYY
mgnify:CR=1 FL=1|tara:strand:+ start:395671 stop:399822 length:4152 start_codon:yes stop_codon:yes gene_type:complete